MISVFNSYSFIRIHPGKIGVKTAQNSIHFVANRKKCSVFNGYSDFEFQTKILFCLILYAKAAISPNVYPVMYSLDDDAVAPCRAVPHDAMPMPLPMPLDNDVSLPLAAGRTAQCNPPPWGVLA